MHLNKEEVTKLVGQKIREIRLKRRLTIEQAAHNAGLEYTQLSRIELGKINTSIYQAFLISQSLDIKISDIFKEVYVHNGHAKANHHAQNGQIKSGNHSKKSKKS
jgi:transcriptional regulator with XRE-family HTH domain